MTWFRVHPASADPADLLDSEMQMSISQCSVATDEVRDGISVCRSLPALAEYLAISGLQWDPDASVVLELEGPRSDQEDEDAELGAFLIHPTEIVAVSDVTELLDLIEEVFDAAERSDPID